MKQKIIYLILISGILVSNWSCEKESPDYFNGGRFYLLDKNTLHSVIDKDSSVMYNIDSIRFIYAGNDTGMYSGSKIVFEFHKFQIKSENINDTCKRTEYAYSINPRIYYAPYSSTKDLIEHPVHAEFYVQLSNNDIDTLVIDYTYCEDEASPFSDDVIYCDNSTYNGQSLKTTINISWCEEIKIQYFTK